MKRSAQAKWQGDLKTGSGTIATASGTLAATPYSFHSRFEQGKGTNPEELLAAAHAVSRAARKFPIRAEQKGTTSSFSFS
jgi:organic hydroperoxide reductase OsmC/OhrA